jgi:transcriptional regulator with XRE-family HTH domain
MQYHRGMNANLVSLPKGMPLPSLKRIRLQKSFSQGDLAREADLAERTVAYAEAGYAVTLRTTRKLARALGVEPDDLRADSDD